MKKLTDKEKMDLENEELNIQILWILSNLSFGYLKDLEKMVYNDSKTKEKNRKSKFFITLDFMHSR